MESGGAKNSYTPSATTSTPSTSPKMSPSLRPRHFISREDGTLTALIAVDELPPAVRIAGVPQNLQPSQIEGMKSCGVEPHRHQYYIIEATKEESLNGPGNQEINHQAGDNNENAALSKGYQAPNPEASTIPGLSGVQNGQRLHGVESWRHDVKGVDHTQATIDAITAANAVKAIERTPYGSATPNAVTPGTFGKKVYCTHWIRRGECDYTQQGCLYKHEMPDEATLDAIGIKGYPRWYTEANPNLFPVTGWSGRTMESSNPWRAQTARLAITAPTSPFVGPVHGSSDVRALNYRQPTPVFPSSQAPFSRFAGQLHGTSHRFTLPQAVSSILPQANTTLRTPLNISPRSPDFVHFMSTQTQGQQLQIPNIVAPHPPNMKVSSEVTAGPSLKTPEPAQATSRAAPQFWSNTNSTVAAHSKPESVGSAIKTELSQHGGTAKFDASTSVRQTRDEASAAPRQPAVAERPSSILSTLPHLTSIPASTGKLNAPGRFVAPDHQPTHTRAATSAPPSSDSDRASEKPASFARFSSMQTDKPPTPQPAAPQQSSFITNGSATKPLTSAVDHQDNTTVDHTPDASIHNKPTSPNPVNAPDKTVSNSQAPLPYFLPSYSVLVPSPASASKPCTSSPLQQYELTTPVPAPKNLPIGIPVTSPPHHRRLFVAAGEEKPVFVSKKAEKAQDKKDVGKDAVKEETSNRAEEKKVNGSNGKKHNGGREKKTSPKASNGHRSKESKNGNGANGGNTKDGTVGEGNGDKLIEI